MSEGELLSLLIGRREEDGIQGLHDAPLLPYTADPNGFLIGFLGDERLLRSPQSNMANFWIFAVYIVKARYRGEAMAPDLERRPSSFRRPHLGLMRSQTSKANYERSGFPLAYRNRPLSRKRWQRSMPC